ncbi:MAG TPA: MATE family efflux transporter [Ktedonobacterales bacterium]|nr:MATE family efflux transporter [Ktedonobacterales bacterium]
MRNPRALDTRARLVSPVRAMRQLAWPPPIWRIGRAPVAPAVSIAPAADVALELPAGGSSARLPIPGRSGVSHQVARPAGLRDDMPDAELRRRIWALSAPAIGEQLLALGVGVSDTFLSGHLSAYASARLGYGQATAVAAVGAAAMMTWVVLTAFFAVNVGVTALVARATGARDSRLAAKAAGQGALMGGIAGLVMLALAAPLADLIAMALGVNGQVAELAAQFIRVSSVGLPATGIASACTAAMRGAGDTRRPVVVMLAVNGVNVVASWLLLNGEPALGIQPVGVIGSAIGAAAGWTLGALLAVTLLARRHPLAPRLSRAALTPDVSVARRALRIGLPSAAELTVFQAGVLTFNHQVVSLGSVPYAANVTINGVEALGTLPAFGFSVAATALVGQALGANSPKLAKRAAMAALWPCLGVMVALGLLAAAIPQVMLGLFVADPAVLRAGDVAQRLSLLILPASGATFIFNGSLRGAGDTKFPVLVRAAGSWGLRVPLAALLIPIFGLAGGRLAMSMDFLTQAGLAYWRFRGGKWRQTRV